MKIYIFLIELTYVWLTFASKFKVTMPGAISSKPDDYICTSIPLPEFRNKIAYVTSFTPIVNGSVHHIILSGCVYWLNTLEPSKPGKCENICRTSILYSWAHNGHPLLLPKDTAFPIGYETQIKSLSMEVHYMKKETTPDFPRIELTYTNTPKLFKAGILLLSNLEQTIPPNVQHFGTNISCRLFTPSPIFVFGIRTHAHSLGRAVIGYYIHNLDQGFQVLAKGNSMWPQTFYKPTQLSAKSNWIRLSNGDILMARCVYDSTERERETIMGATNDDEMCNLYLMYAINARYSMPSDSQFCIDDNIMLAWENAPDDSFDYAPVEPPPEPIISNDQLEFVVNPNWHIKGMSIGQVSGIAVSEGPKNELFVFHRGLNNYEPNAFDDNFLFKDSTVDYVESPILKVDPLSGSILETFGDNIFLMPHGLSIEKSENGLPVALWLTDLALHQVFKFDWEKWDKPSLVFGKKGIPGNDKFTFCQPTDVAVASTGEVFIADGYCNQRIVKFSSGGQYITSWGVAGKNQYTNEKSGFQVVHSITIIPPQTVYNSGYRSKEQVCVTDRERGQIDCYDLDGNRIAVYGGNILQPSAFGLTYNANFKMLFYLTGGYLESDFEWDEPINGPQIVMFPPVLVSKVEEVPERGFQIAVNNETFLLDIDGIEMLANVHDIEVMANGSYIFISELEKPFIRKIKIIKFGKHFKIFNLTNRISPSIVAKNKSPHILNSFSSKIVASALLLVLCIVISIAFFVLFSALTGRKTYILKSHWNLRRRRSTNLHQFKNKQIKTKCYNSNYFFPLSQSENNILNFEDSDENLDENDSNTVMDMQSFTTIHKLKQNRKLISKMSNGDKNISNNLPSSDIHITA